MLEGQELAEAQSSRAEEIRLENERLMYAKKSKSEFLANMNRKVRTPMTSIIGFAELLGQKQQGGLDEKQERYAENILSSSKHLFGIISSILDISSVDEGKLELVFEEISILRILDGILDLVKEKARKGNVILKKEIDPAVEFIEADPVRLKQILFNIIGNAVSFSKPEGGTVNIIVNKEGNMVKISVADTGIGIKEEDKGRLFKEFEQLDSGITRKYGGTGIGLATTKRLVELHGGKIMVESKYGEGTTFTFLLPLRRGRNGTDAA
jgi:signal transduction histidine kinase